MKKIIIGAGTLVSLAVPVAAVVSCSSANAEPELTSGQYNLKQGGSSGALGAPIQTEWNEFLAKLVSVSSKEANNEIIDTYKLSADVSVNGRTYHKDDVFEIHRVDYRDSYSEVKFGYLTTNATSATPIIEFWKAPRRDC